MNATTSKLKAWGLSLLLSGLAIQSYGQDFFEMMQQDGVNLYAVQKAAQAHFDQVGTGKGTGYKLFKRWEYWASRKIDDNGNVQSQDEVYKAMKSYRARQASKNGTINPNWVELGPKSWVRSSSWSPGMGRITAIAVEPVNQNLIYAYASE